MAMYTVKAPLIMPFTYAEVHVHVQQMLQFIGIYVHENVESKN